MTRQGAGRLRKCSASALALLVVGAVAATFGVAPAVASTQTSPRAQGAAGLPIQVFVDGLTPRVVRPHTTIDVVGRLTNTAATSVSDVRVRARVRTRPVGSRSELAADAVPSDALGVPLFATATLVSATLGPGSTAPFHLQVAADDLHLGAFGVYPFAVEALGSDTGGPNDIVGREPTFLPWVPPGGGFAPTRVAWVMPLVDAPNRSATPVFPDDHLATSVSAGGRLSSVLSAGIRVGPGTLREPAPGRRQPVDVQRAVPVTWAVDPALLQSIADMSDGYRVAAHGHSTVAGNGQSAAAAWLDSFRRALHGSPGPDALLALPYGNVDVTALARPGSGLESDITAAVSHGRDVATSVTGVSPATQLGWPAGGFITMKALDDLAASGVRAVVLQDSALPPTHSLIYTPTAGAPLETANGTLTAVLADGELGHIVATADRGALAAATTPPPTPSASPTDTGSTPSPGDELPTAAPTTARLLEQRFLAETALITAERPTDSRDVVITPPADWNPVPGLATALIEDTGRVPWLTGIPLTAVAADSSVEREPLTYPATAASSELPRSYLSDRSNGVVAIRRDLTEFRSILAPPIGATAVALNDATFRSESAAWRADLSDGLALRGQVSDELTAERGAVNISSSRRLITLASRRATIPITISNDLDQAVDVGLELSAVSSARLSAPRTESQTIAAGRKITVEVQAVVNQAGLFPIKAQLLTPEQEPYGPPVTLRLRSTAYGQLALGITVSALGALLFAIIFRLVRRSRRRNAAEAAQPT